MKLRAYSALLALHSLGRLLELRRSRRHERWLRAHGGFEVDPGDFPAMVALHAGLPIASLLEVALARRRFRPALAVPALVALAGGTALRLWAIATLGRRWTVRVMVVPGAPVVTAGPYRYLRHPNYLGVVLEVAALPLVHGAVITATLASLADAAIILHRIRVEETALSDHEPYAASLGDRPRLWPTRAHP